MLICFTAMLFLIGKIPFQYYFVPNSWYWKANVTGIKTFPTSIILWREREREITLFQQKHLPPNKNILTPKNYFLKKAQKTVKKKPSETRG